MIADSFNLHQIRFRPRLCPGPRCGAYSAAPDPVPDFRDPTSKEDGGQGKMNGTPFWQIPGSAPEYKQIDYGVRNDSTRALQAI